jgi:tRNA pseudouridine55 synthase
MLVHNGNPVFLQQVDLEKKPERGIYYRMYDSGNHFLGIYEYQQEKSWLKPQKMFLGGNQE